MPPSYWPCRSQPHGPHPQGTYNLLTGTHSAQNHGSLINSSPTEPQVWLYTEPLGPSCPRGFVWWVTEERVLAQAGPLGIITDALAKEGWRMHFPYIWSTPRLIDQKGTLRKNRTIYLPDKYHIWTLLCWKDAARETCFKNLVRQSLYLQTGDLTGIPMPLETEPSPAL